MIFSWARDSPDVMEGGGTRPGETRYQGQAHDTGEV